MEHEDSSKDRISSLPRDVTETILELLSFPEAVRTSILSRKWRSKWKTLSKIRLSSNFTDADQLERVINRILLLHTSKIHQCHLYIPLGLFRVPDIIPFIYHLSVNGIKDLSIFNDVGHFRLVLPSYLFYSPELTCLYVWGCLFGPPPDFSGFSCLVSLECRNTVFKGVTFESFLPSCPLLEKLSLDNCTCVGDLVIDAPNLKYLSIERCYDIKSMYLKNTHNVTTAYIQMYSSLKIADQKQTSSPSMISVFNALPRIEKLTLGDYGDSYLKLLASGGVPLTLATPLNRLKFLKLDFISFFNVYQISCALCLIRSCPNLQELHILGIESVDDDMSRVMRYLEEDHIGAAHSSLDQLEKISINWMRGANPELEIIKFLLAASPTLKTLNVRFKSNAAADVMLRVSMELLSFQRASSEAKVIVNTP